MRKRVTERDFPVRRDLQVTDFQANGPVVAANPGGGALARQQLSPLPQWVRSHAEGELASLASIRKNGILVTVVLKGLTLGSCFHQLLKVLPISCFEQSIPSIQDVIVIDFQT